MWHAPSHIIACGGGTVRVRPILKNEICMRRYSALLLICCMMATACGKSIRTMLEPGVSQELAAFRKKQISQVSYDLHFRIPASLDSAVTGHAVIRFLQARAMYGVILDFQGSADMIHEVVVNGHSDRYDFYNGHLVISSKHIIPSYNEIHISFTATDQALNRSEDFMYTLFVPDRASTAFPCFDQPDLKATFRLSLDIPGGWTALSNGPLEHQETVGNRSTMVFAADQPVSTYLFAFAAGRFDTITDDSHNRTMTLYHRETDIEKLAHNLPRIFRQHAEALAWLEDYTGIPYPFAKFDMILVPGFQYGGMEHPGAIYYRDIRLLLDQQAPITQQLAKANLIAHETAHMWFGDLVTMQWFDDVWLKEVFAGFMADKIVNPQYPEINHDLQFLLTHYPRALAVDRSRGTHPIKQELTNMNQAGALYGAIIYNKAPVVFQELERLMGEESFRKAVREYLSAYYLDNADWKDLAAIFDIHSPENIMEWSRKWIYGTGMPDIYRQGMTAEYLRAADYVEAHEAFLQSDMPAAAYFGQLLQQLSEEDNSQTARYLISNIQSVYWQFFSHKQRLAFAGALEELLYDRLENSEADEKATYLEAYTDMAISPEAIIKMQSLYLSTTDIPGLTITEAQKFGLLIALSLRNFPEAENWLGQLMSHTTNPDRYRRMDYLKPGLSGDRSQRDLFFSRLKEPAHRRPEPWALEGLRLLHHPLRNESGRHYISESLVLLEEIQRTGDIFFPLRWLDAVLGNYGDKATAGLVQEYLDQHPDLSPNLQLKVLQAADLLFRAAERGRDGGTGGLRD